MALVKCKECGNEVSTTAKTCPKCGAKVGPKHYGCGALIVAFIVVVIMVKCISNVSDTTSSSSSSGNSESAARQYESQWHPEFHKGITQTLAENGIRGCGEYKYKASLKHDNEYVVYCTSDGKNWSAYLVWTSIKKVTGPHRTDPSFD